MENKNLSIYLLNFVTNALINFDHGIIPACTTDMKFDLGIDDIGLGLMGSSVYGGLVIGSFLGTGIFSKFKTKRIVTISVLCCILSLSLFILTKNIFLLFLSRFLTGFFQVRNINLFGVPSSFFPCLDRLIW
ncbi:unnamed protein product [Paramecium octaurelia]|uniref:Major facilitator superfamily (MFS) profile domain-containing protein n=1 Tax=Paramecium octaurelia TaxID=43137 RepID=A0A8S1RZP0_PAROT|nr:unnamed protein product [Paramecium octaurelia]